MKIRQETKGESKKTMVAFAIAAAISLTVVHTYAFGAGDPNRKLIKSLDQKNVQYVISDGDLFVIDDTDPELLCKLSKQTGANIKKVFNSKTAKQVNCK